ncbi:aa3-type cytochrome c oxidase subunit IV [Polycladidibacter hongkongensis]|uniref:aa3-type cytochrome c oxidase subunit IV n=1 Tax=Polycladidibacter hongkongensis TaxID=1647556 RepID=UPI000AD6873A|nr:aa3-type cytochrome c oxidase subunit IV [Pseudovibrio hongkongensis]
MSDGAVSVMDYDEHNRTYNGFINFSKAGTITLLTIVLCLAMVGFGGGGGKVAAVVFTLLSIVGLGIGMASGDKAHRAPGAVFLLAGLTTLVLVS